MTDERPDPRLGIYRTLEDVPPQDRLSHPDTIARFKGRDAWAEYVEATSPRDSADAARTHWGEIMTERDTHPALAEPEDADRYADYLLTEMSPMTAKTEWGIIYRWYHWMTWHTDYPHRYNSLLLADSPQVHQVRHWYIIPESAIPPAHEEADQ